MVTARRAWSITRLRSYEVSELRGGAETPSPRNPVTNSSVPFEHPELALVLRRGRRSAGLGGVRLVTLLTRHELDRREVLLREGGVDCRQLLRRPTLQVVIDVGHLAVDRIRAVDLHLRRASFVENHAAVDVGDVLAEALFTGDHAAFLRRHDLLADRVD